MCYKLTLTIGERMAIDHIGDRYSHGYDLWDILTDTHDWAFGTLKDGDNTDWGWLSDCDITFTLEENQAWAVLGIAEQCQHRWDCFSPELAKKMERFVNGIV